MMTRTLLNGLFGAGVLWLATALSAQADTPNAALDLMRESEQRLKGNDSQSVYRMELIDSSGEVKVTREMIRLEKRMEGRTATLVRFTAPESVKNVGLLIEDKGEAVNDVWSYTPSTRTLRRMAGGQKQNWFMGTDFTYEDFEDYKIGRYDYALLGEPAPCLIYPACQAVEARPRADESNVSAYSRKVYYLEMETLYPVQIDYRDKNDELVKQLKAEGLHDVNGFARPTVQTMFNLREHKSTRMTTTSEQVNQGIADNQISQRALRTER